MNSPVWKPITGFEGRYEVSDLGQIRSLPSGRVLRGSKAGRGYPTVSLSLQGIVTRRYIHHVVAEAFIGPRPAGMDVCHNNGDISDPSAVNLRYDTRNGNMRDSLEHGSHRSVGRSQCDKGHALTPDNILHYQSRASDGGIKTRNRCRECHRIKSAREYANKRSLRAA